MHETKIAVGNLGKKLNRKLSELETSYLPCSNMLTPGRRLADDIRACFILAGLITLPRCRTPDKYYNSLVKLSFCESNGVKNNYKL